jgi:hypothetical protein
MLALIFAASLGQAMADLQQANDRLAQSCFQAGFQSGRGAGILEAAQALGAPDGPALRDLRRHRNDQPPQGCGSMRSHK